MAPNRTTWARNSRGYSKRIIALQIASLDCPTEAVKFRRAFQL